MKGLLTSKEFGFRFVALARLALVLMAVLAALGGVLGAFDSMVQDYVKLCFYFMTVALAVVTGKGVDNWIEKAREAGGKAMEALDDE